MRLSDVLEEVRALRHRWEDLQHRAPAETAGSDTGRPFWSEALEILRRLEARLPDLERQGHDAEIRGRLLREVLEGQEQERRRIARYLHNGISQTLTALALGLQIATGATTLNDIRARLGELIRLCAVAVAEARHLAHGLRLSVLDDFGLAFGLRHLAAEWSDQFGVSVELEVGELAARRFPFELETTLYRIVQETLFHIVDVTTTKAVQLLVRPARGLVEMEVYLEGQGLEGAGGALSPRPSAVPGLAHVRERAALLGGAVTLEVRQGKGTLLSVRIPVAEESHAEDTSLHCG